MDILPLEDTSDRLSRVSERLHLLDDLVDGLDHPGGLLAYLILGNLVHIGRNLILDPVCYLLVLDELVIQFIELLRIRLIDSLAQIAESVAADFRKMDDFLLGLFERKLCSGKRTS